jgi:hypothetical protein
MYRFIGFFLLVAIAITGYFYVSAGSLPLFLSNVLQKTEETPLIEAQSPTLTKAEVIETNAVDSDNKSSVTLPVSTEQEQKQAKSHVQSITSAAKTPIEIKSADHFVTADQLLELPIVNNDIATLSQADSPLLIVSAPKEENALLDKVQINANNLAAAQSFAVKIPSFKKIIKTDTVALPTIAQPSTSYQSTASLVNKIDQPISTSDSNSTDSSESQTITDSVKPSQTALIQPKGESSNNSSVVNSPTKTAIVQPEIKTAGILVSDISDSKTALIQPATETVDILVVDNSHSKTAVNQPTVESFDIVVVDNSNATTAIVKLKSIKTSEPSSIFNTLKKNIEEISDIKIADLTALVKESIIDNSNNTETQTTNKIIVSEVNVGAPNTTFSQPSLASSAVSLQAVPETTSQKTSAALITSSTSSKKIVQQVKKTSNNYIQLRELLSDTEANKNRIFYLHAVNNTDEQGIWGIIQQGLMGTFSKGIMLPQANGTLKTLIPVDADEILSSKQSSFLGKLLNDKVLTTYVYNYEQGNIGKNPDYIQPGQQLIIVTFTEQELMDVYQHFKNEHNKQ